MPRLKIFVNIITPYAEIKEVKISYVLCTPGAPVGMWTCPHQVLGEFYKNSNLKSKFNFVSIPSLELTYFTSADSDVKEKEFVENVETHFKQIGESFDPIILFERQI